MRQRCRGPEQRDAILQNKQYKEYLITVDQTDHSESMQKTFSITHGVVIETTTNFGLYHDRLKICEAKMLD